MIRVTSMSKMINRIINKKNRIEKSFRDIEFRFISHSNEEFLLDHFFINFLRNIGIMSIILVTSIMIMKYRVSIYIMSGRFYIGTLVDRKYGLGLDKFLVRKLYICLIVMLL